MHRSLIMKFIHQSCWCFHIFFLNGAHKTFIILILYSGLVTFSNLNENNNLNSKALTTSKKHPILTTTSTTKEISSGTYVFSNLNEYQGPRQIPIIDDENSNINGKISTSTTTSKPTSTTTETTPHNFRVCAWRKAPEKCFKICHIFGIRKPK